MSESHSGQGEADNSTGGHYKKTRICRECDKVYANRAGLRYHYKNTECSGYECPKCGSDYFISRDGVKRHYGRQHEGSIWGELTECGNCGKEYRERVHRVENCSVTYCSKECQKEHYNTEDSPITVHSGKEHHNYSKVKVECDGCGEMFRKTRAYVEKHEYHYCCFDCLKVGRSKRYSGEGHPLFEGGYEYYGHNWNEVAKEVRKRDNYKCQACGLSQSSHGKALNVHHIRPLREFDDYEKANKKDNLISLCDSCHRKWEGIQLKPVLID